MADRVDARYDGKGTSPVTQRHLWHKLWHSSPDLVLPQHCCNTSTPQEERSEAVRTLCRAPLSALQKLPNALG